MPGFVFRLIGPRPSFPFDMSDQEREAMVAHISYWQGLSAQGKVLAFGPVADPAGPYGIGILVADDLAQVEAWRDRDPVLLADLGFRSEIAPMMRLVTPDATYEALPPS